MAMVVGCCDDSDIMLGARADSIPSSRGDRDAELPSFGDRSPAAAGEGDVGARTVSNDLAGYPSAAIDGRAAEETENRACFRSVLIVAANSETFRPAAGRVGKNLPSSTTVLPRRTTR